MKNLDLIKATTFIILIAVCLLSCKKSSSVNNGTTNGSNSTIFHDNNLKLVDLSNGNVSGNGAGAYDIFGNGTAYINVGGYVSGYSINGSAGNSSSVVGTGANAISYNSTYFNHIDQSLVIEILDTTITRFCQRYNFAQFYSLTTYNQTTFTLPPASYSKFINNGGGDLSFYGYDPSYSCGTSSFLYSPFANGGYLIFRVRNIQTNKCNYGWIRVMVSSGNNFVSPISFSEIAYSKTQDVLLAPGYY